MKDELATIESALIDTRSKDPRLFAYGLKEKFNGLFDSVDSADYVPPVNARLMYDELAARLDEQTAFFEEAVSAHGGAINRAVAATGVGMVGE